MITIYDGRKVEGRRLFQQAASGVTRQAMEVLPAIFSALTYKVDTPRARLEWLSTPPLAERSPVIECIKDIDNPIRMLWGLLYETPYCASSTPKDGKVLHLAR